MYLHNVAFVESPTLLHMQDKEEIAYCTHQTMRGTLGPVNWRQVRGQHQMQSRDSASNASSHETLSSSFERPKCQRLVITHPTQNAPRPTQHHGTQKHHVQSHHTMSEQTCYHYHSPSWSISFQCSDVSLNGIQWVCWVCTKLIQIPEFMQGTATAGHGLPHPNGGVVTLDASVDPQYIVMVRNVWCLHTTVISLGHPLVLLNLHLQCGFIVTNPTLNKQILLKWVYKTPYKNALIFR